MYIIFALIIIIAYLLGSVPFGLLIVKAHGKDLRSIGSGNIGATNVSRALGRKWAYICFFLDALKGLVPMLLVFFLVKPSAFQSNTEKVIYFWLWLAVGCSAILGHIFPLYVKFKGGKGVATSFGVALGLWPHLTISALLSIVIWLAVVLKWHYVSLASIIASISFPLVLILAIALIQSWEFANLWPLLLISLIIPLIVITRHRENINKLIAGTESKVLKNV